MLGLIAILLATRLAAAQTNILTGLSSQCLDSASQLLTGPFGQCAHLSGLISVFTTSGSIVEPVNSYLSGLCPATPCSDDVVSSAGSSLDSACSSDVAANRTTAIALVSIVDNFDNVRNALCSQATSNNTYCLTNLLSDLEKASGTSLDASGLLGVVTGPEITSKLSGVLCTDCGHAIYTELAPVVESVSTDAKTKIDSEASQLCGASFVDGQIPRTVTIQSGSSNRTSNSESGGSNGDTSTVAGSAHANFASAVLLVVGLLSTIVTIML